MELHVRRYSTIILLYSLSATCHTIIQSSFHEAVKVCQLSLVVINEPN